MPKDEECQPLVKCHLCNVRMLPSRKARLPIEKTHFLSSNMLLFGDSKALPTEDEIRAVIYVCPKCGQIAFLTDERSKNFLVRLTPDAHLKRCLKCGKAIPLAQEECQFCGANQTGYVEP